MSHDMMSQENFMQARFHCQHHFRLSVSALAGASLLSQIGLGLVNSFLTWEGGEGGWLDGVPSASNPPSYLESN